MLGKGLLPWALGRMALKGLGRKVFKRLEGRYSRGGQEGIQEAGLTVIEQEHDPALEPLSVYVYLSTYACILQIEMGMEPLEHTLSS